MWLIFFVTEDTWMRMQKKCDSYLSSHESSNTWVRMWMSEKSESRTHSSFVTHMSLILFIVRDSYVSHWCVFSFVTPTSLEREVGVTNEKKHQWATYESRTMNENVNERKVGVTNEKTHQWETYESRTKRHINERHTSHERWIRMWMWMWREVPLLLTFTCQEKKDFSWQFVTHMNHERCMRMWEVGLLLLLTFTQGAPSTSNENVGIPQWAVGCRNRRIPGIPQILPESRSTEICVEQ